MHVYIIMLYIYSHFMYKIPFNYHSYEKKSVKTAKKIQVNKIAQNKHE